MCTFSRKVGNTGNMIRFYKNSACRGKDHPLQYRDKKKGLLTQTEKTPEPLSPPPPPPLHRGLCSPCESWVGALHRYLQLGRSLACALGMRRGKGIFLTQGEICSHRESNSGPWRYRLELSPLRYESLVTIRFY
jgi:hypothetical protein